jgi:hypothetical protein
LHRPLVHPGGSTSGVFTGALYQTTGPYFGGAFNQSALSATQVGTVTFNAASSSAATLSYTVNGTAVTKNVVRQTWAGDDTTGTYMGGTLGTWSSCGPSRNGYQESPITLTVAQGGTNVTMREDGPNYTCTYTANYGASGRFGTLAGNGLCSDGSNFTFTASDMLVSREALTMRLSFSQVGGCKFDGRMGGMRKGS